MKPEGFMMLRERAPNRRSISAQGKRNMSRAKTGEANPLAKLKAEDVKHIKLLIKIGKNDTEIGRIYGVSHSTIWSIRHGRTWKNVE